MSRSTKHFVRHYVEMVVAMFLGMAVLGFPADRAMDAIGRDARTSSCSSAWRRR